MADKEEAETEGGPVVVDEPTRVSKKSARPAAKRKTSGGSIVVAEGKSVCCSRAHGIKGPGETVTADLFADGQAALDDLLEKGYLVRA